MRAPEMLSLALGLLLMIAPLALGQPAESDEAAIRALIEATETANNAGDVAEWVALLSDDAVYMPNGAPAVTTREGLVEVAQAGFRNKAEIAIEPVEIEVAGEWAFARNAVTGTVQLHGSGEVISVDVKQIVIYRRDPTGEWEIARLIGNSNG